MVDLAKARRQMVDCQIRPNDVTDHDVIRAFESVPREIFIPQSKRAIAYSDKELPLATANDDVPRSLMQVTPFAKMLSAAEITPDDVVLCIGCGCGYGAAVTSHLASSVVAIDEDEALCNLASEKLGDLGIDNIAVITSDHAKGYAKEAPFDVILIEGTIEVVPEDLFKQLRDGGRLIAIEGEGLSANLNIYTKRENDHSVRRIANAMAPSLPGFKQEPGFVF